MTSKVSPKEMIDWTEVLNDITRNCDMDTQTAVEKHFRQALVAQQEKTKKLVLERVRERLEKQIKLFEEEVKPLREEYDSEYRLWFDGVKNEKRKRLLKEYENGAKGNHKFRLEIQIEILSGLLSKLSEMEEEK